MNNWLFLILIGSVALLMYGMKVMSEGLQKMAGNKLRNVLGKTPDGRLGGILTGAFIATSIQSSTACTVMTVSFVSAGILTLAQAISVIMGANIGTTATAWLMVLGVSASYIRYAVFAAFVAGMACIYSSRSRSLGEFFIGLGLMFLGLTTLFACAADMHLADHAAMSVVRTLSSMGFLSYLVFLLIGGLLTLAVQSSSAVMAITMMLCAVRVLDVDMGIALVMGENIGTTITSNIAARSANVQARRAAMAHLVFNVIGILWLIIVLPHFLRLVYALTGYDPAAESASPVRVSLVLAAFHTLFNVLNTVLLVGFVKPIERLVSHLVRPREDAEQEDEEERLQYIRGGLMSTAELSILEAKKEIILFADRCMKMYSYVETLLHMEKGIEFSKLHARIAKLEQMADDMELEIADYLSKVSEGRLSAVSKLEVQRMLRMVSELESIGDSCFNLAGTIARKRQQASADFTDRQYEHIQNMMSLAEEALEQMMLVVRHGDQRNVDIKKSYILEQEINKYRSQLKTQNLVDVNNHLYSYQTGVFYMDLISEIEKLGDYVINVVEATGVGERKFAGA